MNPKDLISVLPDFLSYFIPGATCLIIYNFLFLKKSDHDKFLFWSIIISYTSKIFIDTFIHSRFNLFLHAIFCIFAPILLFGVKRIGIGDWFDRITGLSSEENIWLKTINWGNDNYIALHLSDNSIYTGIIYSVDRDWIILKSYDDDKESNSGDEIDYKILCIPIPKIERFEMSYVDDDKMKKKFYPEK